MTKLPKDRRKRIRGKLVKGLGPNHNDENYLIFVHYRDRSEPRHPDATYSLPHPDKHRHPNTICDYIRVLRTDL